MRDQCDYKKAEED